MTIPAGTVTDLVKDNPVVKGCTISNQLFNDQVTSTTFSLAANTSISAARYASYQLITVEEGRLTVTIADSQHELQQGDSLVTPKDTPVALAAAKDCIYTEISFTQDAVLSSLIQPGKVFKMADLIPYQQGEIINCDLVTGQGFKLALMALGAGTELAEHSAPGNALIFALAGQGTVNYEGTPKALRTNAALKMAQGARHAVKADQDYKMALLVMTPAEA